MIIIEANLGNTGSEKTTITKAIENILSQHPNAIIWLVTETPGCIRDIHKNFAVDNDNNQFKKNFII